MRPKAEDLVMAEHVFEDRDWVYQALWPRRRLCRLSDQVAQCAAARRLAFPIFGWYRVLDPAADELVEGEDDRRVALRTHLPAGVVGDRPLVPSPPGRTRRRAPDDPDALRGRPL
jgi:hypothetical protein